MSRRAMGDRSAPLGLILSGGASRRLGGGDKTLLRLGPSTLLQAIVDRFAPQCSGLLLSANGEPTRFTAAGLAVVADHVEDVGRGPLAGVLAGLDRAALGPAPVPLVVSVPGDVPFLPRDLVARLVEARTTSGATIACARSGGRSHPLIALWPLALRADLRRALRTEGLRRVSGFLARVAVVEVDWPVLPRDPFLNVNTPDDLRAARRLASGGPASDAADAEDGDRTDPLD